MSVSVSMYVSVVYCSEGSKKKRIFNDKRLGHDLLEGGLVLSGEGGKGGL